MQNNTFTHTARSGDWMKQMVLRNYEPGAVQPRNLRSYEPGLVQSGTLTTQDVKKTLSSEEAEEEEPLFGTHLREAVKAIKDLVA